MAKSENNEVMYGARGRVGNLVVFKNFGANQTVISRLKKKVENPVYTEKQEAAKERFREAVVYAKSIIADPDLLEIYQRAAKPGISAYNMALADFCRRPEIRIIDASSYQGNIGDTVRIRVIDNFFVSKVKLSIVDKDGIEIEQGYAIQSPNSIDWFYTAQVTSIDLQGMVFKAEATDRPGNTTLAKTTI